MVAPRYRSVCAPTEFSENGSVVPFWASDPTFFPHVSEDGLKQIANHHHGRFMGIQRAAIRDHARFVGAALSALKKKLAHRQFTAWLEVNFVGSPETARVYMRIARNWDKLDESLKETGSLSEIRKALRVAPEIDPDTSSLNGDDDGTNAVADQASGDREIPIILDLSRADEFERLADALREQYAVPTFYDAVFEAVSREASRA